MFLRQLVLLQIEWVLRSRHGLEKRLIIDVISGLPDATDGRFEDDPAAEEAPYLWKDTSAQFADCLFGAKKGSHGRRETATFDVKASKLPGFIAA